MPSLDPDISPQEIVENNQKNARNTMLGLAIVTWILGIIFFILARREVMSDTSELGTVVVWIGTMVTNWISASIFLTGYLLSILNE